LDCLLYAVHATSSECMSNDLFLTSNGEVLHLYVPSILIVSTVSGFFLYNEFRFDTDHANGYYSRGRCTLQLRHLQGREGINFVIFQGWHVMAFSRICSVQGTKAVIV